MGLSVRGVCCCLHACPVHAHAASRGGGVRAGLLLGPLGTKGSLEAERCLRRFTAPREWPTVSLAHEAEVPQHTVELMPPLAELCIKLV